MDWRWYLLLGYVIAGTAVIKWAFKLPPDNNLDELNEELKKEIEEEKQQELKNKQ